MHHARSIFTLSANTASSKRNEDTLELPLWHYVAEIGGANLMQQRTRRAGAQHLLAFGVRAQVCARPLVRLRGEQSQRRTYCERD
jgi:hypothetical protein